MPKPSSTMSCPGTSKTQIWRWLRSYDRASNPVKMSLDALDCIILRWC